jgi:hypothetical protein
MNEDAPEDTPKDAGNKRSASAQNWFRRYWDVAYLVVAGGAILLVGWGAIVRGAQAASAALALIGGGALVVAPFAHRLQGRLRIGGVEMNLQQRVVEEALGASPEALKGVLPLLESREVATRVVPLPDRMADHALTELEFVRKELQVSVIAVRLPTENHWRAGGQVSDLRLSRGTELLVAGPPDSIQALLDQVS